MGTERPMGLWVPAKSLHLILQGGSPPEEGAGQSKKGKSPSTSAWDGWFEFPTWSLYLV